MARGKASDIDGMEVSVRRCPQCGKPFIPKRSDQRYCTSKCRNNASYARTHGIEAPAAAKPRKRKPRRKAKPKAKPEASLSSEDFAEMMNPVGTYEDMLRLGVRKLKDAVEDPSTNPTALPSLVKQLLAASRELEAFDGDPDSGPDDPEDDEVDVDDSFSAETI